MYDTLNFSFGFLPPQSTSDHRPLTYVGSLRRKRILSLSTSDRVRSTSLEIEITAGEIVTLLEMLMTPGPTCV